ncbi:SH3 domain-containing protein [Nonomuraea typhae]|uniref:SH3 domain-containing protein n=1 Tax=Nonomuraea typhae TaxID=2603600 RepID=A0ABW7YY54_9ACTN
MRKLMVGTALVLAACFPAVAAVASAGAASAGVHQTTVASASSMYLKYVCARDLWLRNEPAGQRVATLYRGTVVNVIGHDGIWRLVDSPAGRGWVHGGYLC